METSGYIALSSQMALRQRMDVISQNVANLNTSGFKGEDMVFSEVLQETDDGKNLSFVENASMVRNMNAGPLALTANALDVAIRGEGYFGVETPLGERYTRAGSFRLDGDGRIVTADGHPVQSDVGGEIVVPPDSGEVTIARDGTVSVQTGELGRIGVFRFENEELLVKTEAQLYDPLDQAAEPVEEASVEQGMIEGSNVQGVLEMTKLIETVRRYQAVSKLVEDEHRRQRQMIEALGGN